MFIVNYFHSIRVKLAQSTSALEVVVFKIKAGSNSTFNSFTVLVVGVVGQSL